MTVTTATSPDTITSTVAHPVGEKRKNGMWWRYVLGVIALIWALFPLVFILSAALNPSGTLSTTDLIPKNASTANFTQLFEIRPYWAWYKNTLIICGVGAFASVFIGASAAYAFSRMRFKGRRAGLMALLLAQMFPVMLAFVAIYLTFDFIGESLPLIGLNTQAGLILAYLGGAMGANVWLLKGYFDTVPKELDEAAKVDGAGHARIFFTMTLRLVLPILATVGMLAFVGLFSEFLLASIFLKDADNQTLAVGLWSLLKADRNKYFGPFCAGALLASVPVMALYLAVQKYLVGGLTAGSVK
ncbi:sugar ABC transporter permease [Intrasporangium oryzae NRRL B-24470]|uniref:Sugar ABC transporter permease n=1 Tax=Intrasporangium oryzae NRRL B-24470 TaxID=1386089 RepID=W9G1L8_9MICO|nr:sugar ABC transporter permease [Intrasporangium oryzae]EWS99849.1 sugar ABC transporter permease [Intrasporangium oryzae NRRL B-24470]